jgi:hypothetical protein
MIDTRRQKLRSLWASLGVLVAAAAALGAEATTAARNLESEVRIKNDIFFLASPECEGRGPLTGGIDRAADFIAAEFKKVGLKPVGADGSWFQPFTIPGNKLEGPAVLVLRGPAGQTVELRQGVHFQPFGMAGPGKLTAPVAFVGYGITGKESGYNDYQGLDVAGKVVIALRDTPRATATEKEVVFEGSRRRQLASFTEKLANAERHKVAAILFVNDAETARTGDDLLDFNYTALARTSNKLPAFHIRRAVLETMLLRSGAELSALEREIDRDLKPRSRILEGWTANLELKTKRDRVGLKNVVGVLEGAGPLAKETVVVGAHYDHLGFGSGSSLANLKKMTIHHGADDNASGTTGLLELARRFGAMQNRQGRRLVFIAFSGEELGLFGSDHYVKSPIYPLADTASMFNLDMIGRLRPDNETKKDKLLIEGAGSAKTFNELLDTLNRKFDFKMVKKASGAGPSDHASFYAKKVPVLFFWTDYHADYHRPSDTADKINIAGLRKVVDLGEDVVMHMATVEKRPEFVEVKGGSSTAGRGPRLGIAPADDAKGDGAVIAEVEPGAPADKAGLKKGDRIVTFAGKPIKDFKALVVELGNQQSGTTVEVVIQRDGKPITVKVELAFMPRLGIRPNYSDEKEGVLIDGVNAGEPAANAGIKAGDRIVEMGGKPVKDLESYMKILPAAVKGDTVEVTILREGKKETVKVKVK